MSKIDKHQQAWATARKKLPASRGTKPQVHPASSQKIALAKKPTQPKVAVSTAATVGSVTGNPSAELMLIKLDSDITRIANQASRQKKHEIQRQILPSYDDYLTAAIANPPSGDDPVLVQCMIWRFNLGDIDKAVTLADHAIDHDLSMPEAFKANVNQFLCREVGYWALEQQKNDASPEPYLSNVFARSRDWDKPDQIEAVLFKAMGNQIIDENPEKALEYFEKAAPLDDRIGVSQIIKRLKKQLETPAPPQEQQ